MDYPIELKTLGHSYILLISMVNRISFVFDFGSVFELEFNFSFTFDHSNKEETL